MAAAEGLFEYLLRLGDNDLILSHRLSEWCGHGPNLEEDLAQTNVALDLLGQARHWLTLAGAVEGAGRDEDQLAYRRDAGQFRNVLLVEQPNGDYAATIVRQVYFDAWHQLLLERLAHSADQQIADIATKALKEVRYHWRRSRDWLVRLGDGTEESQRRMQQAVDELWPYSGELFEMDAIDRTLLAQGIAVDLAVLRAPWLERLQAACDEATLRLPAESWAQRGGKHGVHSEHLGFILAEMQFLQRAYPDARW